MISIKNLTKIYKSKNKSGCIALDKISFDLPDSGMVFILGKSGSGKSTLLNLIGGLDGFNKGEICFNGARLSRFRSKDYYDYRGNHVGFVFQDYHLLDELTVKENIALALDISDESHGRKIKDALKKVGMEEYATRYPKELSGGQKQRIAMARAIVKNPDIILCDEPTGNLDVNTSRQLLELLKEISKSRLVIIVSHNIGDAEKYADRVIELANGKICRDVTRKDGYSNAFSLSEETLTLPYNSNLTESEIDTMVRGIRSGKIKKVVQNGDGFTDTENKAYEVGRYRKKRTKMSFKNTFKFTKIFMRSKFLSFTVTAFMAALIVSCFAVFQSFLHFDSNKALADTLVKNELDAIVYQKRQKLLGSDMLDTNYLLHITDDDIKEFTDAGYNGNVYKLYDHALIALPNGSDIIGAKKSRNAGKNITAFYINETYGVLECNKEFLTGIYGKDGELNVLAGDITQPNRGIIITDYVADSIIFGAKHMYPDYDSLIGVYKYSLSGSRYAVIDAVIETGYEERYTPIKEKIESIQNSSADYTKELAELSTTEEFLKFAEEVQLYLGISYTFSEDYIADMSSSTDFLEWGFGAKLSVTCGENLYELETTPWVTTENKYTKNIAEGHAVLPYSVFNNAAGTNYTPYNVSSFVPTEITLTVYSYDGLALGEKTLLVSELTTINYIYLNSEDFLDLRPCFTSPYSLYFDNVSDVAILNETADRTSFAVNSIESHNASKLNKVVITFEGLFTMFEIFLLVICVIYLMVFGANIIKKNKYQIGVIKALGGKTNQIARIFITQLLLVGMLIFIMSGIGIYIATSLANEILISSVRTHMNIYIYNLTIIDFIPKLTVIDLILVIVITVLSSLAPLIAIHKIKPINIIKAKE